MKRFNLIIAIAISTIMFTACEKEESSPNNNPLTQSVKEKSNLNHNKSEYEYNIDTMAMAANIETIGAVNGGYSISFYNSSDVYIVNINVFDEETLIDMDIADPNGNIHNINIDPQVETISIGNIGDYTFQQYENYIISPSENTVKNLMAVMTIYHATQPNSSRAFGDNGDEDEFDPNPDPNNSNGIFWGKTKSNQQKVGGVADSPCYYMYTECKYRLWINFGCEDFVIDYENPIPC